MNITDVVRGHDTEPRIVVLRGLPGSGKSTVAAELAATLTAAVVCRDTIREIHFHRHGVLSRTDEDTVSQIEFQQASDHLAAGHMVVIDSTNLAAEYVRRWTGFAADRRVACLVIDVHAPVHVCVDRAAARARAGGHDVPARAIHALHRRYPPRSWSPPADHSIGDPGPADITPTRPRPRHQRPRRRANPARTKPRGEQGPAPADGTTPGSTHSSGRRGDRAGSLGHRISPMIGQVVRWPLLLRGWSPAQPAVITRYAGMRALPSHLVAATEYSIEIPRRRPIIDAGSPAGRCRTGRVGLA